MKKKVLVAFFDVSQVKFSVKHFRFLMYSSIFCALKRNIKTPFYALFYILFGKS